MMFAAAAQPQAALPFDPTMIILIVLAVVMLLFMWRGNKQRAAQQQAMKTKLVPGAEVMTQAGIFGRIVEIDEERAVTTIETSPGVTMRVHSATVANVVEPAVPDDASSLAVDADEHVAPVVPDDASSLDAGEPDANAASHGSTSLAADAGESAEADRLGDPVAADEAEAVEGEERPGRDDEPRA